MRQDTFDKRVAGASLDSSITALVSAVRIDPTLRQYMANIEHDVRELRSIVAEVAQIADADAPDVPCDSSGCFWCRSVEFEAKQVGR